MCTRAKSGDEVYKYERSTFIPASPLQDSNNLHDKRQCFRENCSRLHSGA